MTALTWDGSGQRRYETGVDHGVLYIPDNTGAYVNGYAWNGLTTVTESPTGAESNKQYADNIVYLNLVSLEQFGATIEAFTYPDEFAQCDGTATPEPGVYVGQQPRKGFGFSYRTKVGNDLNDELGYQIHLVYGCKAAPSEKARNTINDSPEAATFSWELTTVPVDAGEGFKPTSYLCFDSTKVDADALAALEDMLYGSVGVDPQLPPVPTVLALFTGTITEVTPTAPTYNASTDIITIPTVTGVEYLVGGEVVPSGAYGPITSNTLVTSRPTPGHVFADGVDDDWLIVFS